MNEHTLHGLTQKSFLLKLPDSQCQLCCCISFRCTCELHFHQILHVANIEVKLLDNETQLHILKAKFQEIHGRIDY